MENLLTERLAKLNTEMRAQKVDCTVICNSPNLYYMTGFSPKKCERLLVALLPVDEEPVLIVSSIYEPEAIKSCNINDRRVWHDGDDVFKLVREVLTEKKLLGKRLAIDNSADFGQLAYFIEASPSTTFTPAATLMAKLRMYKTPEEIELMRESGKLTDMAIGMLAEEVVKGRSEMDLHTWIEYELGIRGMRQGFSNIISYGENTVSGHHVPSSRLPKPGDAVMFDIGGAYNHYWSDATRTFFYGQPPQKFIDTYQRVQETQQLAAEAIKPGVRACDINTLAHENLDKYGLGRFFHHHLGHGVGLDGHERPNLRAGETTILEPGMSFSCEPGVYFQGEWGIRIEDTVVVTKTGCESFNHFTKDPTIL